MIERDERPSSKPGTKKLTIRIDEEMHRDLKVFAAQTRFSINEIVVGLIKEVLQKDSGGL